MGMEDDKLWHEGNEQKTQSLCLLEKEQLMRSERTRERLILDVERLSKRNQELDGKQLRKQPPRAPNFCEPEFITQELY